MSNEQCPMIKRAGRAHRRLTVAGVKQSMQVVYLNYLAKVPESFRLEKSQRFTAAGGVCHSLVRRPWCRWFILNKLLSQKTPTPKSPSPAPLPPSLSPSVAVPPSAAVWSMPLCRVLWFVLNKLLSQQKKFSHFWQKNYLCQKFSINYFRQKSKTNKNISSEIKTISCIHSTYFIAR